MVEIRFHGRGGQGAVTSAELLAQAAIEEGKYAQAFPAFGAERRGAPVLAFTRISDEKIKLRTGVYHPDVVLILDTSLVKAVPVTAGLKEGGLVILNSKRAPGDWKKELGRDDVKVASVDATTIALKELGVPITNVIMLGALLKAKPLVGMEPLEGFIAQRFPRIAEKEIRAFRKAYEEARVE